jgi:hypothetical protein
MAHADLDALLNAVIPFTQQMLSAHGEFYPVGASMSSAGEIALASAASETERPKSQDIIDDLVAYFRAEASNGGIRACIVCYDGRVAPPGHTEKSDAICAWLEHQCGESIALFLPYSKGTPGDLEYGELFASPMDSQVFAGASS